VLSLILSFIGGVVAALGLYFSWPGHPYASVFAGIAVFLGAMAAINFMLKNKLEAAFKVVQQHLTDKQTQINRKIKHMAGRATPKFQAEIEKDQADSIREAIKLLKIVEPFEKWNIMVKRQEDTLRAQFYYQLKEYAEADKYFKNALLMDPMLMAMQMARFYKLGKMGEVAKCFKKGARRFKDEKGTLIYALYSWILVESGKMDEAIQVLVQAKTKCDNEILKQNWDHLVNGRVKRFSNAALGEQWFALALEAPKMQRIREQPSFGGFGGFGHRRH